MKKYLLVTVMALVLALPGAAWCQGPGDNDGGGPQNEGGPSGGPQGPGGPGGGRDNPQQFQQRKAEVLKRIGEHQAELQKVQSCVEAANDGQALRACMPRRPDGGRPGGFRPGGMQQGGSQGGSMPGGGPMNGGSDEGGQ